MEKAGDAYKAVDTEMEGRRCVTEGEGVRKGVAIARAERQGS